MKKHTFDQGSKEEADFFNIWYRKEGYLKVYCRDLEWLENENFFKVKDTLKKKGDKLSLYVKQTNHKIVEELVSVGVNLFLVKEDIRSEHAFSIRENGGFNSIILRNKNIQFNKSQPDKIQIEEYHDSPTLVNLALDMLDDCIKSSTHKGKKGKESKKKKKKVDVKILE